MNYYAQSLAVCVYVWGGGGGGHNKKETAFIQFTDLPELKKKLKDLPGSSHVLLFEDIRGGGG